MSSEHELVSLLCAWIGDITLGMDRGHYFGHGSGDITSGMDQGHYFRHGLGTLPHTHEALRPLPAVLANQTTGEGQLTELFA